MNFTFAHNNLNVYDLDASLRFYKEALGLTVTRTKEADDGSFKLVYLGDSTTPHKLELTWLRDMDRPYNLGDNEIHLAFETDDFDAQLSLIETLSLLESSKQDYDGVAQLGIEALALKIQGMRVTDIAKIYKVPPSHVGAWISRSIAKLRNDPKFLEELH